MLCKIFVLNHIDRSEKEDTFFDHELTGFWIEQNQKSQFGCTLHTCNHMQNANVSRSRFRL